MADKVKADTTTTGTTPNFVLEVSRACRIR